MKITAPISRIDEIGPLAEAGVDEFYCGVVPREWVDRFRTSATNRRIFGNLQSYDDLAAAVEAAHGRGRSMFLVLNAQHYAGEQMDALLELARRFDEAGGDAVIVGDVSLLGLLAAGGFRFGLHVSSILSCRNSAAARFYKELGATRVIFPRDVTLDEIAEVAAAVPGIEYEAFILNDGCVFEEGTCHTIHLPSRLGGPICLDRWDGDFTRTDGKAVEAAAIEHNEAQYKNWLWYRFGCGFSVSEQGYPFGPCGVCAMPRLRRAGLHSVKIAGREAATGRKLKSVELVKSVLAAMDTHGGAEAATMAFAQDLRKRPDLCASGYMCYYREVLDGASSAAGGKGRSGPCP